MHVCSQYLSWATERAGCQSEAPFSTLCGASLHTFILEKNIYCTLSRQTISGKTSDQDRVAYQRDNRKTSRVLKALYSTLEKNWKSSKPVEILLIVKMEIIGNNKQLHFTFVIFSYWPFLIVITLLSWHQVLNIDLPFPTSTRTCSNIGLLNTNIVINEEINWQEINYHDKKTCQIISCIKRGMKNRPQATEDSIKFFFFLKLAILSSSILLKESGVRFPKALLANCWQVSSLPA